MPAMPGGEGPGLPLRGVEARDARGSGMNRVDRREHVGPYEVIRTIGRGGMAEVLLARLPGADGSEREVVIKRILPELASRKEFIDMFRDEARITAQLRHGNIVQVLEFRQDEDQYSLVLEYVDGTTLAALIDTARKRGTPLPHAVVAHVLSEVARALDYAHRKRGADGALLEIVHRDVSPSNVLVSRDGEVKLTDFGIARATSRVSSTSGGEIKGKLSYMAPDALMGEATSRSDLFSLGVMGWELLVGHLPFDAESIEARMFRVLREPAASVASLVPGVPASLSALIERLLVKAPEERTSRASDIPDALGPLVAATSGTIPDMLAQLVREVAMDAPSAPLAVTKVEEKRRVALIVDGSFMARAIYRGALGTSLRTIDLRDASAALDAARDIDVALVIAQQSLAGEATGIELCRLLRADPAHARMTFVLVVDPTAELEQSAREAGVSFIVSKSAPDALVLALERVVAEMG